MTVTSTELINYAGMTDAQIQQVVGTLKEQGIPEVTLRLNAMNTWSTGAPSASEVATTKSFITALKAATITINLDMHTWYTTWDSYFRDSASNSASNRSKYLTYIKNTIQAFNGYDIKTWMVLNEPQARTASSSENQFIRDCVNTAKLYTDKPVSVRFMAGYSASTGHYASDIDNLTDFMCRNSYWDPRKPDTSVYGCTKAKLEALYAKGVQLAKEVWITEFGKSKSNLSEQAAYIKAWVEYAKTKTISKIFAWVSQPLNGSGESYNLFNGFNPNPAFYELKNDVIPPVDPTITVNSTIDVTSNLDGGGNTYIHGPNLGNNPLFHLKGTGVKLSNCVIDDNNVTGTWSAVVIGGTDNVVEDCTLKNCVRYGMTFGGAIRGTYRRIIIEKCQHGISGSSGSVGQWNPSIDCIIEDCTIKNMSVDGIKLKNLERCTISGNSIDVASVAGVKSGIYFAGSDTANKDCTVEGNIIYSSIPGKGTGILIHQDQQTNTSVVSTGNIVQNNIIKDTSIGVRLTGSHYQILNNKMTDVAEEYVVEELVYGSTDYPPPSDNIIVKYGEPTDPCQQYIDEITDLSADLYACQTQAETYLLQIDSLKASLQYEKDLNAELQKKIDDAIAVLS